MIIVAGLLSNSPVHDAIISQYDSPDIRADKRAIYGADRNHSNSTDVPGDHYDHYITVPVS